MKSFLIETIPCSTHEKVIKFTDKTTSLKAIIAIHNTNRGPGLGGCRVWNYNSEEEALTDVLRLSCGMSYKNALANLNLGGAKAVIIGDPKIVKTPENLRIFGTFVEYLEGKYITAPDVNTDIYDMEYIQETTKHVVSLPERKGGSGDPSLMTAYGVFMGIKAAVKQAFGSEDLSQKKIGIEGIGKVGTFLVDMLSNENAKLYVTDINKEALSRIAQKYKVEVIDSAKFYDLDMDIYAPCALGATLNESTISRLKCKIVAGAANNQLEDPTKDGQMLFDKNIIYVPDYAINAGGVINVYTELISKYSLENARKNVKTIYDTCINILKLSEERKTPSNIIADFLAKESLSQKN